MDLAEHRQGQGKGDKERKRVRGEDSLLESVVVVQCGAVAWLELTHLTNDVLACLRAEILFYRQI